MCRYCVVLQRDSSLARVGARSFVSKVLPTGRIWVASRYPLRSLS